MQITSDLIKRIFLDIFSSSQIVAVYIIILYSLITFNTYTLYLYIMIFLKTYILSLIKKYTINLKIGKRPKEAFNCNMFSCGGKTVTGGMPSGHMMLLTMFMVVFSINLKNEGKLTNNIVKISVVILLLTGLGRYLSKCHTLLQIIVGLSCGIPMGLFIYYLETYIQKVSPRFAKNKNTFYNDIFRVKNIIKEKFDSYY